MTLEKFNKIVKFKSAPCLFPTLEAINSLPTIIAAFYSEIIIPYEAVRLAAHTLKDVTGIEVFYVLGKNDCIKCDKNQIANLLLQNTFTTKSDIVKMIQKIDVIYDRLVVFHIKNNHLVKNDSIIYCNILEDDWKSKLLKGLQYVCRPT
jgi:hypothetical protein